MNRIPRLVALLLAAVAGAANAQTQPSYIPGADANETVDRVGRAQPQREVMPRLNWLGDPPPAAGVPAHGATPREGTAADGRTGDLRQQRGSLDATLDAVATRSRTPRARNEFERFVANVAGGPLRTFGEDLVVDPRQTFSPEAENPVPSDYALRPGDEILVRTTGSYQENLSAVVDRAGQVHLPRVGAVPVGGVRADHLQELLQQHIGNRYRAFDLSVVVGRLRNVRVYVTGFAANPGAYTLGGLSTLVNAVMAAGGPSEAGSLRDVELRRGTRLVTRLDMYDLLLGGDKSADVVLQAEDVIRIGPVGPQVAIFGSVNAPAIYEAKASETLADLIRFAGGLGSVADASRFAVERLANRGATVVEEFPLANAAATPLTRGDVFRIFSAVDYAIPIERQSKLVRIDGEVNRPGDYFMPPGSTLAQLIERAGGLTPRAYVFGSQFTRETVRRQQQLSYERALQDFEQAVTNSALTRRVSSGEAALQRSQQLESAQRMVARLRQLRPEGRVVLGLSPQDTTVPDMPLEHGDRLYVPPRPTTVHVFGSVFNAGSFAYAPKSKLKRYLRMAGGPRRGADTDSIFVVRADGAVQSNRQGWRADVAGETALPGDALFVPEEMNKTSFMDGVKDISQVLFHFGLSAAAIAVLFSL